MLYQVKRYLNRETLLLESGDMSKTGMKVIIGISIYTLTFILELLRAKYLIPIWVNNADRYSGIIILSVLGVCVLFGILMGLGCQQNDNARDSDSW